MNTIILILFIALLVSSFIGIIVCSVKISNLKKNQKKLFDDNIWMAFINNINKFTFVEKREYNKNSHDWIYIWSYGGYTINVWVLNNRKDIPYASIHSENGDCVLCSFNKKRSTEMARKLLHLLWDVR